VIDTTSTYHAAYILVALIFGAYAVSLWLRARKLRERLAAAEAEPRAE
jgi:hypothetical protein